MSSLDFEPDDVLSQMELEWREVHEASLLARADYQALAASPRSSELLLEAARRRLERTEAQRSRVMARIEHLEATLIDAH
jgi:predicted Zn-dependent protease